MKARKMNLAVEEIVGKNIGAVVDFAGEAYVDEIADHIREQLGEDTVNQLLAETGKTTVDEVVLMYLDERAGAGQ